MRQSTGLKAMSSYRASKLTGNQAHLLSTGQFLLDALQLIVHVSLLRLHVCGLLILCLLCCISVRLLGTAVCCSLGFECLQLLVLLSELLTKVLLLRAMLLCMLRQPLLHLAAVLGLQTGNARRELLHALAIALRQVPLGFQLQ